MSDMKSIFLRYLHVSQHDTFILNNTFLSLAIPKHFYRSMIKKLMITEKQAHRTEELDKLYHINIKVQKKGKGPEKKKEVHESQRS